jgi:hypothetical protein
MIPLLNAAEDKKGLLEVACWMGILNTHINAFSDAVDALTAAVGLCDDPSIAEFLPDNSALDMVREDNKNVFSFPTLKYLHSNPAEIAANIRELLSIVQAEQSS